jgi:G3E family GTPase
MREWLRETVGPSTSIVEAAFGNVPTDVLLGARDTAAADERPRARDHHHEHGDHHPRYETWSWSGDAPLSGAGLVEALKGLSEGIIRAKGILHLREDARHRYVLQLVGRRYSVAPHLPWNDEQPRSRIVVIGLADSVDERRLDETMARLSLSPAGEAPPATTSGASGGD